MKFGQVSRYYLYNCNAIAIANHCSFPSCLIGFPFLHTCNPFTSPCLLCITHSALSSAKKSCPWRHTNTCRNEGYNAVADDLRRQPSSDQDSALAPDRRGRKDQILWVHTHPTVSSRPRGRCVQSMVQIGLEMWICIRYKQTNKQNFSFIYKMTHLFTAIGLTYSGSRTVHIYTQTTHSTTQLTTITVQLTTE